MIYLYKQFMLYTNQFLFFFLFNKNFFQDFLNLPQIFDENDQCSFVGGDCIIIRFSAMKGC